MFDRRRKNRKAHLANYYDDEEAMVAKEPLTPRSRWLKDVLELKENQAEKHVDATTVPVTTPQAMEQPLRNASRNDNEVETFLQFGNEENTKDGLPAQTDVIEDGLQERVECLKKKVSKTKTKKKSKSDESPSSAQSTPAPARQRLMIDPMDAQVVAAVMKVREGERNAKSSNKKSADPKARPPKRNLSPRRPVVVSDQHRQQVVEIKPKVDKLSITTKECVLKAMTHQDPPGVETPRTPFVTSSSTTSMPRSQMVTAGMARESSFGSSSMAPLVTQSLTTETPTNVAKATKLRKKKEKKMSWLRKALTSIDNPKQIVEGIITPRAVEPTVPTFEDTTDKPTETATSPIQQQLWLSEFRKAQNEAKVAEELMSKEREAYPPLTPLARIAQPPPQVDTTLGNSSFGYTPQSQRRSPSPTRRGQPRQRENNNNHRSPSPRQNLSPSRRVADLVEELASPRCTDEQPEQSLQLTKYYYEQGEAAIVMDYSSFDDDAESVSSIEMLFNWLSCKDPSTNMRIDHRGKLVVATNSILSDNLTWDEEQRAKKRFSS